MANVQHATVSGADLHEDKRIKQPVRAASTANVTLTAPGSTIDGVTLANGDRLLLKDQSTASQNGLYVWSGASSTLVRATDAAAAADFGYGFLVYVREGTANAATLWQFTQSAALTIGTTALTFGQVGSVGTFAGEVTGTDFKATGLAGSVAASRYVGATASGAPSTGAHLLGDFVVDQTGKFWVCTTAGTPGTWVQSAAVAISYSATGLTGATAASRYVGATATGAPSSGTFALGDFAIDQTGKLWICTTAGSPGTWTQVSGAATTSPLAVAARLRISANQSIATATATPINWDTEDTDTDNQHYTSSANLTGTVSKTNASATLTGSGTAFTTELSVGQVISVPGGATEKRVVTAIASDTSLTVNSNFANTSSGQTAARVNSALVFRTAGFYWVEAGILAASATWTMQLRLNGSTIIGDSPQAGATTGGQVFAAQQFAQWDYVEVVVTQSSGSSVNVTADQRTYLADGVSGYVAAPYACVQHSVASGTHGGGCTAATWNTRPLNVVQSDDSGIVALASNQITLQAGTYEINARSVAFACSSSKTRLRNITDSTTTLLGSDVYHSSTTAAESVVSGRFKILSAKTFELQHWTQNTVATNGLGPSATSGESSIFASVDIRKVG